MKLTPTILQATYAMLDECAPFKRWNLPDAEDVNFKVGKSAECHGWHHHPDWSRGKKSTITINGLDNPFLLNVVMTMAHEMIHLHMSRIPNATRGSHHNATFQHYADQVCKALDFDRSRF